MKTHNLNIMQDMQHQLFFVRVGSGNAYLKYEKPDESVMDIKETYVPKSSREKGVATELAEHAFEYAASKNMKVKPTCPFVSRFIEKKPEYKNLVKQK